jgi:hypothetical protein
MLIVPIAWSQGTLQWYMDLPVSWVEDADSRVKILRTGWDDVRGVLRLKRNLVRDRARCR